MPTKPTTFIPQYLTCYRFEYIIKSIKDIYVYCHATIIWQNSSNTIYISELLSTCILCTYQTPIVYKYTYYNLCCICHTHSSFSAMVQP